MIGTTIGNFEVVRQIGKGGMGEVWLAEHKDIKTKVAIKMLLPHISEDKQQVQRFFNEAVAVSKIKHAGIVKIFDVGYRTSGEAYLVMEYLEGESIATRLARVHRLRIAELSEITRQIASVLEATHVQGITHRDLKPDNLFLVADAELPRGERVKVLDFGIAKLSGSTAMTGSGAIGTPLYMSPEQWKTPAGVDGRADVYSLGCIVFEMACGRPPFVADTIGAACQLHLNEPVPSMRARVATIPAQLEAIVTSMLAKDPAQRASLGDVKAAFVALGALPDAAAEVAATQPQGAAGDAITIATAAPRPRGAPIATTLGSAASMVSVPTARSPRRLWPIFAVIGAAAVGVSVIATRGGDAPAARASAPVPQVTPEPPPVASAPARIHIIASPAAAEVRIDGAIVGNPFSGEFPRDQLSHHITVTAPGYQPRSELVTFAADRELTYELATSPPDHREPHKVHPAPPDAAVAASPDGGKTIYKGTQGNLITEEPNK